MHNFVSFSSTQQNWKCIFAKCLQTDVAHEVAAYVRKTVVDSIGNYSNRDSLTMK
jgi:hypothetical protein